MKRGPVYIRNLQAFFLFLSQYLLLAALLLTGPLLPYTSYLILPYLAGWSLGMWSIQTMGIANINAGPDPLPGSQLVRNGPYARIRHPMYTAILLVFIPLLVEHFTFFRLFLLILLVINLAFKIRCEERQMKQSFCREYPDYVSGTWHLIPYII